MFKFYFRISFIVFINIVIHFHSMIINLLIIRVYWNKTNWYILIVEYFSFQEKYKESV